MYIAPLLDSKTMQLSGRHSIFVTWMNECRKYNSVQGQQVDRHAIQCCPESVIGFREGSLLGNVDGGDKMKVEFGACHVSWWIGQSTRGGLGQCSGIGQVPLGCPFSSSSLAEL